MSSLRIWVKRVGVGFIACWVRAVLRAGVACMGAAPAPNQRQMAVSADYGSAPESGVAFARRSGCRVCEERLKEASGSGRNTTQHNRQLSILSALSS